MLKIKYSLLVAVACLFFICFGVLESQAQTFEPLTVTDIKIDKTAKNAVDARNQALVDAKRTALQMLVERNVDPSKAKSFKQPSDKALARYVQDFEIRDERMSATRYRAVFTVRFRDSIRNLVDVRETPLTQEATTDDTVVIDSATQAKTAPTAKPEADAGADTDTADSTLEEHQNAEASKASKANAAVTDGAAKTWLLLPYYQMISGKNVLWESGNPWMDAWRKQPISVRGASLVLPLGDIDDVTAGDSQAVWSGETAFVEKLRENYQADRVYAVLANKSGLSLSIDVYAYEQGIFERKARLFPVISNDDEALAFSLGVKAVEDYFKNPSAVKKRTVENISEEVSQHLAHSRGVKVSSDDADAASPEEVDTTVIADTNDEPKPAARETRSGSTVLSAKMSFPSFSRWMDAQKRLSAIEPRVDINIMGITSNSARFTLKYQGSMETLRTALAEHGLALRDGSPYEISIVN